MILVKDKDVLQGAERPFLYIKKAVHTVWKVWVLNFSDIRIALCARCVFQAGRNDNEIS